MLILSGGGSYPQTEETIKWLHKKYKCLKILYIPQARDSQNKYQDCFDWLKREMNNPNYSIEIFNEHYFYTHSELQNFDMLYIGGGNIEKLLNFVNSTQAFKIINFFNNSKKIIMGGSAGAIILGLDCKLYRYYFNKLQNYDGMKYIKNISLACHYQKNKKLKEFNDTYENVLLKFSRNNKCNILAIPEEVSVLIDDDKVRILGGSVFYFNKNNIQIFENLEYFIKINDFVCKKINFMV